MTTMLRRDDLDGAMAVYAALKEQRLLPLKLELYPAGSAPPGTPPGKCTLHVHSEGEVWARLRLWVRERAGSAPGILGIGSGGAHLPPLRVSSA